MMNRLRNRFKLPAPEVDRALEVAGLGLIVVAAGLAFGLAPALALGGVALVVVSWSVGNG